MSSQTFEIVNTDVAAVIEALWTSILGLGLEARESHPGPAESLVENAVVSIVGAFTGCVRLQCGSRLSNKFARILHGSDEPSPQERTEALAEVAQLVAGNLKGLLPGPTRRSLATVFEGEALRLPQARPLATVDFRSDGEPLRVTLYGEED